MPGLNSWLIDLLVVAVLGFDGAETTQISGILPFGFVEARPGAPVLVLVILILGRGIINLLVQMIDSCLVSASRTALATAVPAASELAFPDF